MIAAGGDRLAEVADGVRIVAGLQRGDAKAFEDLGSRLRLGDADGERGDEENAEGPRVQGRRPSAHDGAALSVSDNARFRNVTASSGASSFMHVSASAK